MELYASKLLLLVRLGKPYGPVARGKSIRKHPSVMLWSDAYGRSVGVVVFWPHGRKYTTGSVRCTYVYHTVCADDVQAWKHPRDQSCGLYGARKWPV